MKQFKIGPKTKRLRHRALTKKDAAAFYALNSSPLVMQHTGEPLLASVEQARAAIDAYQDFETVGYGRWGCILKATNKLIGFCGLKHLADLDVVDVGYRFLPHYWGHGLATEACAATIQFGFETIGLAQIDAFVLPDNHASIRVLEKVGMQSIGSFKFDDLVALRYQIQSTYWSITDEMA